MSMRFLVIILGCGTLLWSCSSHVDPPQRTPDSAARANTDTDTGSTGDEIVYASPETSAPPAEELGWTNREQLVAQLQRQRLCELNLQQPTRRLVNISTVNEVCGWPKEAQWRLAASTAMTGMGAPSQAVPFLPWPPPAPSTHVDLTGSVATEGRFAEIASRIEAKLTQRRYDNLLYYGVPGGFAITTELERFTNSGRPPRERRFFAGRVGGWRGVWDYAERLVFGEQGRFRVFVFVVTSQTFSLQFPAVEEDVRRWRSTGSYSLPSAVAAARAPPGTRVTLLIYEFNGGRGRAGGLIAAREHLGAQQHRTWLGF